MKKITQFICLLTLSLGFSQNAPVDFETDGKGMTWTWAIGENGTNPALEIVSNPNIASPNTSAIAAKFTAQVAGEAWALIINEDIGSFTFDNTNSLVKLMVRKNVATNVGVKFEGGVGVDPIQIVAPTTVINGDWQELTFDFSSVEGKTFNKLILIPDYEVRTTENIVYFDNLTFNPQPTSSGPNNVTVDVASNWIGYMEYYNTVADGGAYVEGKAWTVSDLKSTIGATNITLQPNYNAYVAGDPFWSNGEMGNKIMTASTYVESDVTYNSNDLTFSGTVVSNTINSGYTAKFFIKALDKTNNYADVLAGSKMFDLPASGNFTVSATAAQLAPGLVVQYGFVITGLNANPVNEAVYGSVIVGPTSLSTKSVSLSKFVAYPNPTQDNWTISSPKFEITSIQVFDVLGKNVMRLNPNATEVKIEGSTLKSGLYFARVNAANGSSSLKMIKK